MFKTIFGLLVTKVKLLKCCNNPAPSSPPLFPLIAVLASPIFLHAVFDMGVSCSDKPSFWRLSVLDMRGSKLAFIHHNLCQSYVALNLNFRNKRMSKYFTNAITSMKPFLSFVNKVILLLIQYKVSNSQAFFENYEYI